MHCLYQHCSVYFIYAANGQKSNLLPEGLISPLAGAVGGAFAAFILNYLYSLHLSKKNHISNFFIQLKSIVDQIELLSEAYWSKVTADDKRVESKIKALFTQSAGIFKEIKKSAKLSKSNSKRLLEIEGIFKEYFESVTGGDFESSKRKLEPRILNEIYKHGLKVKIKSLAFLNR